jgi:hypothetical protein
MDFSERWQGGGGNGKLLFKRSSSCCGGVKRLPILVGAEVYANQLFLAEHHNPTNEWMLPSSGFVQA